MLKRGWKKSDLARAAQLPLSTIYPLFDEKQLAWPQPQTLARLAAGLGTSVGSLIGDAAPAPSPTWQEALGVIARELESIKETPARDPIVERLAKLGPNAQAAAREAMSAVLDGLEGELAPEAQKRTPEKGK